MFKNDLQAVSDVMENGTYFTVMNYNIILVSGLDY